MRDSTGEILRLAWPVMASQVLLNLTGVIDRMMIGRLAENGSAAVPLAAVGYAGQLYAFVHSTLFAIGLACVALMARSIGSRDTAEARRVFAGSIQVSMVVTFAYVSGLFVYSRPVLALLGAEPEVIAVAAPYLELTMIAALMLALTLIFESAFRANRDPRTPMWIALAVTISKIALNALLIFGLLGAPRLELFGAGLATALSQGLGLLLFLGVLLRQPREAATALRLRDLVRRSPVTRKVIRIALPGVAERIVLNLGLLSYFWILSHWYGTLAVATYTVGVSLLAFSWIPGTGYAQACSTIVGQALGARRSDIAKRAGQRAVLLAITTAVPLALLFGLFRVPLAELFTDDIAVVTALSPFMLALALGQPFLQMHFTLGGAHKGAGDTVTPLLAAMFGNWGIRVPLAVLIGGVLELDIAWIWATLVLDHIARSTWLAVSFQRGHWRQLEPLAASGEAPPERGDASRAGADA